MTNQSVVWGWVAGFSVMVVLVGCAEAERMSAGKYSVDRFGERSSIPAVVDQSVANVVTDTRINGQLASTDIRKLKGHLVGPVCMATGGPCTYSGRDMETIHAGMKISNRHFEALVEDLVKALDMFKVAAHEKGEPLALLGPMKEDIVEAP